MQIGVVLGSIRDGRFGEAVAEWVMDNLPDADGFDFEFIDLKSFDVPLLTAQTVPGAANKQYDSERVTAWSRAIDACDGFVFITAEYNHSVPGAFKNAFDSLGNEWAGKPVGFVSYGAESGVRAVEHWRAIVANFQMVDVRQQCSMSTFNEADENGFKPGDRRTDELATVFEQLLEMTRKLRS